MCNSKPIWSKVTVKAFIIFQRFPFQINSVLLNFPLIKDSLKKISFHKNVKQLFLHIRTFSKGSCDTEYWSNDAEDSALYHRNKLHIVIYFTILLFLLYFWSNICSVVKHKRLLSKTIKSYWWQTYFFFFLYSSLNSITWRFFFSAFLNIPALSFTHFLCVRQYTTVSHLVTVWASLPHRCLHWPCTVSHSLCACLCLSYTC